jgi:PAS domain S-box-containing protein
VPSLTSSTLLLVIGIIELLLGSAVLTFPLPGGWGLPPGPRGLPVIGGAVLAVAGAAALLVQTLPRNLSRGWGALSHVIAALPLLAAAWAGAQMGAVPAWVTYGVLGAATPVAAVVRAPSRGGPTREVELFPLALSFAEAGVGALLLAAPGAFAPPAYADLLASRTIVGPLLLVGAAAGLASALLRPVLFRLLSALIAAGPLVIVAITISRTQGFWAGILVYPMLAALLIAHPWLEASVAARRHGDAEGATAASFERTVEGAVWAVILLIVLGGQTLPATARPALAVLALILTLFTLVWFRLPPAPHERARTLWGTVVYTVGIAALVHLTGGLGSPFFLLFFLPLMAVAWTLRPRTVAVPAGLALTALVVELVLALASGAGTEAVWTAIFRGAGLLLVAVFAYLLAGRAVRQRALVRQEKEKLETIVAAMEEGLIVLDAEGRIQFINRAAERVLHTPAAEALGRPLADLLAVLREDGLPLAGEAHPVTRALLEARPVRQRVLVSGGGSDPVPAAFTATPLRGAEGRPPAVVCSLQDIAAEVEMERMREDFFNIASHEIRTPLTVIKGHVELVLEGALGPLTDRSRHVLTEIHAATGRLVRLVNDFLDAARLDQGRITVQIDRGSLPALVDQAIATLSADAERKGLTISYRQEAPPPVLMDAEKTLQILINLLDNAIKFTPRGGIEIWHDVTDGQVATYIRDTGVGIRPEHRHRLFERFSQVDRGLRRETGGSGLGLYICRRLAERMRGTVALVDSVPDGGSTFLFNLPAVPAPIRAGAGRSG